MPKNGPATAGKIMIAKIYAPDGKGPYRVWDRAARTYYAVWPEKFDELGLEEGDTYSIHYTIGDYNGKPQYTIIGAQPVNGPQPSATPPAPQSNANPSADREISIIVQALAKCVPSWFAQLEPHDAAGVAKILDSLAHAWRLHKNKPSPTQPPPPPSEPEYDDKIPY